MKSIKFVREGNDVRVIDINDEFVSEKLKPAVYSLKFNEFTGYYLTYLYDKFDVPSKIYGSTGIKVSKILKTYSSRNKSTGVLMTGDKGSGKTMASMLLSNSMISNNVPVIMIERAFGGSAFNNMINNIGECVLFFDEFGKIFKGNDDIDPQESLLSVFDGANSCKRLILLTENSERDINSYMLNRPGRVFYHFRYKKLDIDLVKEYCLDKNVPEDVIDSILLRMESSYEFSFDVLQAIVEDYLRFNDSIETIFNDLNIEQPITHHSSKMKVLKVIDQLSNKEYQPVNNEIDSVFSDNRNAAVFIEVSSNHQEDHRDDDDCELMPAKSIKNNQLRLYFGLKDLVKRTSNMYIFRCKERYLIFAEEIVNDFDFNDFSRYTV